MYIEGLSEIDTAILKEIENNARLSCQEIGNRVGISRVAVKNHMDALEKKGVIKGYKTVIDRETVEGIRFFLELETEPEAYEEVCGFLAGSGSIRQIYALGGNCRIHAVGFAPNLNTMKSFANHLYRGVKGLRRLECNPMINTIMDRYEGIEYVRYQESEHLEGTAAEEGGHGLAK